MCNTLKVTYEVTFIFTDLQTIFDKIQLPSFCCALQQAVQTHETLLLLLKFSMLWRPKILPSKLSRQNTVTVYVASPMGAGKRVYLVISVPFSFRSLWLLYWCHSLSLVYGKWPVPQPRNPWPLALQSHLPYSQLPTLAFLCWGFPLDFRTRFVHCLSIACQSRTIRKLTPPEKQPSKAHAT